MQSGKALSMSSSSRPGPDLENRILPIGQVGVVGLGYVGLPLAVAFGRLLPTIGFDVNEQRVAELSQGYDRNGEFTSESLSSSLLTFTHAPDQVSDCDFIIVAVPTPVGKTNQPDLTALRNASCAVGRALRQRSRRLSLKDRTNANNTPPVPIVVYESTVYPGCTEEVCVPILERTSGLRCGQHFKVGYSPERINPGDPEHSLEKVIKVVSAQDSETLQVVSAVYRLIAEAGVHEVSDIRTAEASKIIENVQRDVNIALMNELSMIFHRLGLDTQSVLKAAGTKWNFLRFDPGMVGGHCIPVDPYYLTHKAEEAGYHPEVILTGRRINDSMGAYVAQQALRLLKKAGKTMPGTRVLVMGLTFKENTRDTRNSQVFDLIRELVDFGCCVTAWDPMADQEAMRELEELEVLESLTESSTYDVVIVAVRHRVICDLGLSRVLELISKEGGTGVLVDVKGVWSRVDVEAAGCHYWAL